MDRASPSGPAGLPGPQPPPTPPRPSLLTLLQRRTFRSLRHRDYRLYFLGQNVSFIGSWMQSSALMWLMFASSGDPRWPSWLLVAQVGPTVLLGPIGGACADRFPKIRLIRSTQTLFLLHAFTLALLVGLLDGVDLTVVLVLQVLSGMVQAIDLPTRMALTPELVPKEDVINAVGLNSLMFNSARALGPAAAAIVFALVELASPLWPEGTNRTRLAAALCFLLNAASFLAVLAALRAIQHHHDNSLDPQGPLHRSKSFGVGLMWTNLIEGFRYLFRHPALAGLILLTLGICVFGWPILTLMPAYTASVLGGSEPSYYALFFSFGSGALIAALVTATFGSSQRRHLFLGFGAAITSLGLAGLTLSPWLPLAMIHAASVGCGLILYLATGQSTLQLEVPDAVRGRVLALWAMTLSASAPLGHLIAGQATSDYGVIPVLRCMSAGVFLCACLLVILPRRG